MGHMEKIFENDIDEECGIYLDERMMERGTTLGDTTGEQASNFYQTEISKTPLRFASGRPREQRGLFELEMKRRPIEYSNNRGLYESEMRRRPISYSNNRNLCDNELRSTPLRYDTGYSGVERPGLCDMELGSTSLFYNADGEPNSFQMTHFTGRDRGGPLSEANGFYASTFSDVSRSNFDPDCLTPYSQGICGPLTGGQAMRSLGITSNTDSDSLTPYYQGVGGTLSGGVVMNTLGITSKSTNSDSLTPYFKRIGGALSGGQVMKSLGIDSLKPSGMSQFYDASAGYGDFVGSGLNDFQSSLGREQMGIESSLGMSHNTVYEPLKP